MKTNRVDKAQKPQGNCSSCGTEIRKGDSYFWIKFAYGPRKTFCAKHPPRSSEKTGSDKLSRLYAAQETIEDLLAGEFSRDDLEAALNDAANEAREVADEYRSSKDNLPESLQDSQTGQDLEEKADQCEQWADEMESAASEVGSLEDWEEKEEVEKEEGETEETGETEDEAEADTKQEAIDIAENAIGSLQL